MIERNIINDLIGQLSKPQITILLGARQVGKTTLLKAIAEYCQKQKISTQYWNLEKPSDMNALSGDEDSVYKKITSGPHKVVLIDEFHYLKNASKLFKAVYDTHPEIKIFASGSSSIELHKHLKESLAGRLQKYYIFPLAFDEWKKQEVSSIDEYLVLGGLPGLIHEKTIDDKMRMLESIAETYLLKDIKSLIKEENVRAFNQLLYLLAQHQGSVLPSSNLAREISLSEPTIKKHLTILSQTYVCYEVDSFSKNLANELKKSKKYYLYDLGMRNLLLKDFSTTKDRSDIGVLAETFIYHHLRYQLKPNMEIRFWRNKVGDEVDFIVLKDRKPCPIEVKTTLKIAQITKGMKIFITHYKPKSAYVFSRDFRDQIKFNDTVIYFRPWEEVIGLGI